MPRPRKVVSRRALRIEQNETHPLYLFGLTGEELLTVAEISRVSRNDAGKLIGYQRPEVKHHIQDIVDYLNSADVLFPNSLIIALSSNVRFTTSRGPRTSEGGVTAGTIEIPLPREGQAKPAWIVDGQQRVLALSHSRRKDLVVPINAFVADQVDLQRDQFIRVNNTKPLPRGLLTELLPEVSTPLPRNLEARKIPSSLCDLLNTEPASPFHNLIRRSSASTDINRRATVTDSSVIEMLRESIATPSGCLFPYRNIATNDTDVEGIWALLLVYWNGVKNTFPEAWGKPATKSRLMHGTGIRAMGRVMDKVMAAVNPRARGAQEQVERELQLIAPVCHWTSGRWTELDDLRWDEVQNTKQHIRLLSSTLVRAYVQARGVAV